MTQPITVRLRAVLKRYISTTVKKNYLLKYHVVSSFRL